MLKEKMNVYKDAYYHINNVYRMLDLYCTFAFEKNISLYMERYLHDVIDDIKNNIYYIRNNTNICDLYFDKYDFERFNQIVKDVFDIE